MPEKRTIKRSRAEARKGHRPTTQAGPFVAEEIRHVREGKHGARSTKQAIAIGLSKARRAGVALPPRPRKPSKTGRRRGPPTQPKVTSKRKAQAALRALQREPTTTVSAEALSRQTKRAAAKRTPEQRRRSARAAAAQRTPEERHAAGIKAAKTRRSDRRPAPWRGYSTMSAAELKRGRAALRKQIKIGEAAWRADGSPPGQRNCYVDAAVALAEMQRPRKTRAALPETRFKVVRGRTVLRDDFRTEGRAANYAAKHGGRVVATRGDKRR